MGDEGVGDGGPGVLFADESAGADGHRGKGTVPRFAGSVPAFYGVCPRLAKGAVPSFAGSVPNAMGSVPSGGN